MSPYAFLARIAAEGPYPAGDRFERLQGLAVLGVTFESGHTLALRHFEHTSEGPGFTAVWMREPNGDWRFFSTNAPGKSCAKYMVPEVADQVAINLAWVDDHTLHVSIPALSLRWFIEFQQRRLTRFMTAVISHTPAAVLRHPAGSGAVARIARTLLRAGNMRLSGAVPNGQRFRGLPRHLWAVAASTAWTSTYNFGEVVRAAHQPRFGDFWVPATAIAMGGMVEFSPLPARLPAGGELAAAA